MSRLKNLREHGQSIWLDYIRRSLMTSGELNRLIEEDGLRGMTSNPTIFEKAITGSGDYDESLRRALDQSPHQPIEELYETLVIEDIQMAADILRPVYDESHGRDGLVSLEVSPKLAYETDATIAEAKRLWKSVNRPNLMIKVPATAQGVPAFEALIADGVNVNVTLMFSLRHYELIAKAYIRGLERCQNPERIASVASFFVSRVDSAVDKALAEIGTPAAGELMGEIAVANAKLAYRRFEEIFGGNEFAELEARGARVQRPLWASTSTKNPEYPDVLYVEELIGSDTVNTLPPATLNAFRDHGVAENRLTRDVDRAREQIEQLSALGIDFDAITDKLQVDGVDAFAKSYDGLLEALKKKRRSILSSRAERQYVSLGEFEARVYGRLDQWDEEGFARRLWKKDPTLWSDRELPELSDRLGWLDLPRTAHDEIEEIERFRKEIHGEDFCHAVLLGMGGSSLAPEVFARTFGNKKGYPELTVLDSTHPEAVRSLLDRIDLERTLFFVSSKSGSTIETLTFFKYFWHAMERTSVEAGRHFVAITDPGTPLEELATSRGFRRVFRAPVEVGGRYSALSVFGLVPAAAIGVDVHGIVHGAWAMMENTSPHIPARDNPAFELGAAMGELAALGRDKLTFVTSEALTALPTWIEQLVAESTGKDGKGILPVEGETLAPPESYGDDRFFIEITLRGEGSASGGKLSSLESAGHPVARIEIDDRSLIGQEFFRWEVAAAAAGAVLGIHPFNQPDVQLAKRLAREAMEDKQALDARVWNDGVETVKIDEVGELGGRLEAWLSKARKGDYVGLHAYLAPSTATTEALQEFRLALREMTGLATTLGYGPRFLHSTGQLHKGGLKGGFFVQIVDEFPDPVGVPGGDFTFGDLIRAQAIGDARALVERGQRVLRIDLGTGGISKLSKVTEAIAP